METHGNKFVTLLAIALPMSELQILHGGWMPSLGHRDDVVDTSGEGVGVFFGEIHRLSADSADGLCGIYLFLVRIKLHSMCAVSVGSLYRHMFTPGVLFLRLLKCKCDHHRSGSDRIR